VQRHLALNDKNARTARQPSLTIRRHAHARTDREPASAAIESLPPELMRKGRFDEIFFVDLPNEPVRAGIFGIHLKKHSVTHDDAALAQLVAASDGFSGEEIEAAIVAARL
jgi:SpoVK/Ycf46/Vps4 family AAA+-type ATPase